MKKSCEDCKKAENCNKMAKFSFKGRELGYAACDDGAWPISNADRIRKMTDDELNYLFVLLIECKLDKIGLTDGQTVYEWLKQEVE